MAPNSPDAKKRMVATTPPSSPQCSAAKSSKTTNVSSGNAEEGVDMISFLPHAILGYILTMLNVSEVARTTVLSSKCHDLFSSLDYKFDCINDSDLWPGHRRPLNNVYLTQSVWRSGAITSLLQARHHFIRRFIVQRTLTSEELVSGWLYRLFQSGIVEEFVLKVPCPDTVRLSHYIFNCSSLRSLSLSRCCWPRRDVPSIYSPEWTLPQLTELTLSHMDMTMAAVNDLLRRCPALLSLSLGYPIPRRFEALEVNCKNLLSLTKVGCGWQYAIRIVDAPKLERLMWWPVASWLILERNMLANAPRLHTVGIYQNCPTLKGVMLEQVRNIALLTNVDNFTDLELAFRTLRHLPQLEILHVEMIDGSEGESSRIKRISFKEQAESPIPCLENSVKTIVLRVNNLVRQKVVFTNYLLGAAKSLKSMIIYKKRMAGELLPPEKWGSSGAQIVFGDSSKCTIQFDTSAANYKLADPFMA